MQGTEHLAVRASVTPEVLSWSALWQLSFHSAVVMFVLVLFALGLLGSCSKCHPGGTIGGRAAPAACRMGPAGFAGQAAGEAGAASLLF